MGPEWYDKEVLILGCGNTLLGDDGFGPAVAKHVQANYAIPGNVCVLDAGTSVREILFDTILAEKKPSKVVIVDAIDGEQEPGSIFAVDIESIPEVKLDDFSMHQIPTSNLLRELQELCGVKVDVVVCQTGGTCESVNPGLSKPVAEAVEKAAEMLAKEYF
ncbi:MAG: hydrogenase maturation protease [Sedimentisphaerales bacterium]|nr:hydrogenase maturation protease [Sedimentisphaerales bacterium]